MAAFEKADGFLHWLAGIWSCRSVAGDEQKANERELEREREREREGERERVQYYIVHNNTVKYSTIQYSTIQYST